MIMSNVHWKDYQDDFDKMSDDDIDNESEQCHERIDKDQAWLEAVVAWENAGKPRNK